MKTSGLEMVESVGLSSDDWCAPKVSMKLKLTGGATALKVWVWIKPEANQTRRIEFTSNLDGAKPAPKTVPTNTPYELTYPLSVEPGSTIDVELNCTHKTKAPGDGRELSFVMLSLVAD